MRHLKALLTVLFLCIIMLPVGSVRGTQSSGFTNQNGDWFDSFGIDRNLYSGPDGYLPNLAYETLNSNAELAYNIGVSFKDNYPLTTNRAEAILQFVQANTEYGYDSDNVIQDGVPQEEWAWNADETAHRFNQETGVKAIGDCEDLAFLCATIYTGAGIDAAVVDAPDHVACLIWLPDYPNAGHYWDLPGDNRDAGWIWVEATSSDNPLGWTPPDYNDGNWEAYPITITNSSNTDTSPEPVQPQPPRDSGTLPTDLIVIGVVAIFVVVAILVVASRKKTSTSNPLPPPPPPQDWNGNY
jgi:hypothetical protein